MQRLINPLPIFLDRDGALLDGGNIRVGVAGADPSAQPIVAYWDAALTIVAEQPLRTLGGYLVNGAVPANVFVTETDFSTSVADAFDAPILYAPFNFAGGGFQPLDSDLTAIAALATTPFGRSLLTLANSAALATATGAGAAIPLSGSSAITGNLGRQGAGVYTNWNDAGMTSGRIFLTASGAADPTSLPGDWWLTY